MLGTAFAGDLPSKKTTPAAPAVSAPAAPAESTDTLSVGYGQDIEKNFGSKSGDIYQVNYTHKLGGGFSVGGMAQSTQDTSNVLKQNLEAQAGYTLPSVYGATLSAKVGVGERFVSTGNFPYFAVYGGADYKIVDGITWNALQYRYRSAFDTGANGYQSHQLATGVTYDINSKYSVSAKYARNFDTTSNYNVTGDQFMLAAAVKF
jgi:hypothetical protein